MDNIRRQRSMGPRLRGDDEVRPSPYHPAPILLELVH